VSRLLISGRLEIVDDGEGYGEHLASKLSQLGADAHLVEQVSPEAEGVVFARGLRTVQSMGEAISIQRDAVRAARTLAKRQGERLFVSLQDTGGDFGLSGRAGERAWTGGLAGLAKTAAAEWSDAAVKAIDISCVGIPAETVADRIVGELLFGGRDLEVALTRNGTRAVVHHRPAPYVPISDATSWLQAGSVVIVSGGARGVTAAALIAICKRQPRLVLLGRTELVEESEDTRSAATDADIRRVLLMRARERSATTPSPKELAREAKLILDCKEIRQTVATLRGAGAQVSYRAVDVRDGAAVRSVVEDVRQTWGPIRGIVHGAGVLADALLSAQTDEQFNLVFGTKVDGLHHLLAATAEDPIELLLVFSSVAGRFGNAGQATYAMANEVLSCVAARERARRGPRCLVRSLAWGPWAGGMVTPGLARLFERAGVRLLSLDAGADALAREVDSGDDSAQVILMNGVPPKTARPLGDTLTARQGGHNPAPADQDVGHERLDVVVNSVTAPFLDGHRITGVPVVPAAMVLEWFCRAAYASHPSLSALSCRDLKVLRGIPVDGFGERGIRLVVDAQSVERTGTGPSIEMRLLDEQDKLRYTGVVEMGGDLPVPTSLPESPFEGKPWPWSVAEAYSEVLFHRGPFAAIQSLGIITESGATGEVLGLRALGWPGANWRTDVAALDGGIQVAALWGRSILGRLPLPTRMRAFHLYKGGSLDSTVRCLVRGRRVGRYSTIADVAYVQGAAATSTSVVAYIQDLELHLPPTTGR
jgi:NAD(P)-dependent dehydrogenase (short-subunit alcohol dehydrogenase family)